MDNKILKITEELKTKLKLYKSKIKNSPIWIVEEYSGTGTTVVLAESLIQRALRELKFTNQIEHQNLDIFSTIGPTVLRSGISSLSGGDILLEFDEIRMYHEKENRKIVIENIADLKAYGREVGKYMKAHHNLYPI